MAYQGVAKPKFYIDYLQHIKMLGNLDYTELESGSGESVTRGDINTMIGLDPVTPVLLNHWNEAGPNHILGIDFKLKNEFHSHMIESVNYYGFIGHTAKKTRANPDNADPNNPNGNPLDLVHRVNLKVPAFDSSLVWGQQWAGRLEATNPIINFDHCDNHWGKNTGSDTDGFSITECEYNDELYADLAGIVDDGGNYVNNHLLTNDADPETYDHSEIDQVNIRFIGEDQAWIGGDGVDDYHAWEGEFYLNCFTMGHTYTMPHSPNLDLTMEIEYDGYDQIDTIGGSTFTNVRYAGQPQWGGRLTPWMLGPYWNDSHNIIRAGRRIWNLKFSYIAESDMFSANYQGGGNIDDVNVNQSDWDNIDSDDYRNHGDGTPKNFISNLFRSTSFTTRVLNYIGNGQRFIFQPDSNAQNPSDFAICVLDQDSLNIKQSAHRVYNISMKIREVW